MTTPVSYSYVYSYGLLIYGSSVGYQNTRAQIQLMGSNRLQPAGFIRFCDPNMPFPPDTNTGGIITMYLPSAVFEAVIDILRNEKDIIIYFAAGRGFLSVGTEPVGLGEVEHT
jgi:hypothetical protein